MKDKILWIWNVWRPLRWWFIALILFTLLSTAVAAIYPLILKMVIDRLQESLSGGATGSLSAVLWGLVFIGITRFIVTYYPALRAYLNLLIDMQVRETYFKAILRKSESFFQRFRTGDLVTRLTDDIADYPKIAWFCCSGIFRALNSGSKFLFCLVLMLFLDWRLALLSIVPLPLMMLIFSLVQRKLRKTIEAQRKAISETNDLLECSFSGVRIIKAHNAEPRQGQALKKQLTERIEVEMEVVKLWQLIHSMYNSLGVVGQVVVVAYGGVLVVRGEMTSGTFYAFYVYLGMLVAPLLDLPNLFVTGRQAFVCIDREEEIRLTAIEEEGGVFRGERDLDSFQSLILKGVSFGYPRIQKNEERLAAEEQKALTPVLSGFDLTLKRGERIAIVGRLGAGKSTMLRLALGALKASEGEILWDDEPIAEYDGAKLRRHVGYVSQQAQLFSGRLRDNIVFGRAEDPKLLAEVIDAVGLTKEVNSFPDKVDQILGQDGLKLSGGQRQRVAIARALYGRPSVLFLDDLTSALDAHNEERLWRKLEVLIPECSMLVVTHRIATARAADHICVLSEGHITASGTHHQLLDSSDLYHDFQQEFARSRDVAVLETANSPD